MNSQVEITSEIKNLIKSIKNPITPDSLIRIRALMYSKINVRPYNDFTKNQEREIRWRRTAGEILNDGYVYSGKACTDLVVLFIALCNSLDLKTNFVKVRNGHKVHSVAEILIGVNWYIFDVADKKSIPVKGLITEENSYKDWKLWKKGKDAWDLGLHNFEDIETII